MKGASPRFGTRTKDSIPDGLDLYKSAHWRSGGYLVSVFGISTGSYGQSCVSKTAILQKGLTLDLRHLPGTILGDIG